jgi:uncharacterized protein
VHFEWDDFKADHNFRQHGVPFVEAEEVFNDPDAVGHLDAEHSVDETRYQIIGWSSRRLLMVVYTEEADITRLISARRATATERALYEEKQNK